MATILSIFDQIGGGEEGSKYKQKHTAFENHLPLCISVRIGTDPLYLIHGLKSKQTMCNRYILCLVCCCVECFFFFFLFVWPGLMPCHRNWRCCCHTEPPECCSSVCAALHNSTFVYAIISRYNTKMRRRQRAIFGLFIIQAQSADF